MDIQLHMRSLHTRTYWTKFREVDHSMPFVGEQLIISLRPSYFVIAVLKIQKLYNCKYFLQIYIYFSLYSANSHKKMYVIIYWCPLRNILPHYYQSKSNLLCFHLQAQNFLVPMLSFFCQNWSTHLIHKIKTPKHSTEYAVKLHLRKVFRFSSLNSKRPPDFTGRRPQNGQLRSPTWYIIKNFIYTLEKPWNN